LTTNRFGIRCLFIVAVLLISTGLSEKRSLAWGTKGHQVIARIAEERLSSRARRGVSDLLDGASLESVANWADMVKTGRTGHFVPIPRDENSYDAGKHCPGDCLIKAIERSDSTLRNYNEPKAKRAEALKFIVHLIGDLHQPFHCTDNGDAGGNRVAVYFFGRSTNLHKVWDDDIINQSKPEVGAYAAELSGKVSGKGQSGSLYMRGTTIDWALDSHRLARNAYQANGDKLADEYYNNNKEIVDAQLLKAGIRLAKVLNDIFE
jgi:S1/P1 Nuclease